ncbi:MAG TPA: hypothetical protein VLL98_00090 [Rickettsiales bacterium]|nr:hypothetical protein [Rickettsiales bacterium]
MATNKEIAEKLIKNYDKNLPAGSLVRIIENNNKKREETKKSDKAGQSR